MTSELSIAKEKRAQAIQSKRRISETRAALDKEETRLDVIIQTCSEIIEEASKHCDTSDEPEYKTTKDFILQAIKSSKIPPTAREVLGLLKNMEWTTKATDPMSIIHPELSRLKNMGFIENNGDEKYGLTPKGMKFIRDKE